MVKYVKASESTDKYRVTWDYFERHTEIGRDSWSDNSDSTVVVADSEQDAIAKVFNDMCSHSDNYFGECGELCRVYPGEDQEVDKPHWNTFDVYENNSRYLSETPISEYDTGDRYIIVRDMVAREVYGVAYNFKATKLS